MSLIHSVSDLFSEGTLITPLNNGWEYIELGKHCKIQNGYPFKSSNFNSDKKGMPLIRIRDISNSSQETFYNGDYPDEFIVNKGDLLVGMDGDFNCNLWNSSPSLLNQRVCRIIPDEKKLLTKFLYYGLGGYLKVINENTSSTTVKHLSSRSISEIPYPLPPLTEQERIVAKLDSLFAHLESVKQGLEKIPVLLKQFRQAVLTQAVTGKLTEEWREGKELEDSNSIFLQILNRRLNNKSKKVQNQTIKLRSDLDLFSIPENWRWSDLGFLIDENEAFRYGVVQPGNDIENEQKLIRVKDLENGKILIDNLRGISFQIDNQYKSARVKTGDLLVSIVGTIGRTAIVTPELEGFNIARALAKIPIKDLEVKFLKYYLDSNNGQNWLDGDTREVARKTLNLEQLKTLTVPIPPLKEQTEIVRRVEALFSKANAIEAQYKKMKTQIDQLPQAILAKAFRGEV